MSQLILPNSIDPATPATAAEVQDNFTAIRDLINGNLEGGSGSSGNMKANGITARELDDTLLGYAGLTAALQEGILTAGGLKVTPGAGLALNYAAGRALITDDAGVSAAGMLLPVNVSAGATVTIAANASGNPRIDQIILTMTDWNTGTVSVLQGTATVGATLDNRTGAAALPSNAIRLADILMPNAFAGPFVQNTHIRDRRPWAKGAYKRIVRNTDAAGTDDYSINATGTAVLLDSANLNPRMEFSGVPVRATLKARILQTSSAALAQLALLVNSAGLDGATTAPGGTGPFTAQMPTVGNDSGGPVSLSYDFIPAAGSHTVGWAVATLSAGTLNFFARATYPLQMTVEELLVVNESNDGA